MNRLAIVALVATAACTHAATMVAPPGFGRVDGAYDFRAANPQGIVIAAHAEPNAPRADLEFWVGALDVSLLHKGYTRTEITEVKSRDGLAGRLLKYDVGADTTFWVAVFAGPDRVLVAEATGDKQEVERAAGQIQSSLLSTRLR